MSEYSEWDCGYEEGFQKGKLEQKKEELEILQEIEDNDYSYSLTKEVVKDRIEQLSKEIGGKK